MRPPGLAPSLSTPLNVRVTLAGMASTLGTSRGAPPAPRLAFISVTSPSEIMDFVGLPLAGAASAPLNLIFDGDVTLTTARPGAGGTPRAAPDVLARPPRGTA